MGVVTVKKCIYLRGLLRGRPTDSSERKERPGNKVTKKFFYGFITTNILFAKW